MLFLVLAAGCGSSRGLGLHDRGCEPCNSEVHADCCYVQGGCGEECVRCGPPECCSPWYVDCIDTFLFRKKSRHCADAALKRYRQRCGHDISDDFRDGVRQAYADLAEGGWGLMPAVPPEKYWQADERAPAGQREAQEWFAGYDAGVMWARQDGVDRFRTVAVPPL